MSKGHTATGGKPVTTLSGLPVQPVYGPEDVAGLNRFTRLAEPEFPLFHEQPDPLQGEEGGMPFVHMADVGFDSHEAQRANTTNPEEDFLSYAHVMIAPVETGRYLAVFRSVFFEVGVEKVKGDPPHPHPPDLDLDPPAC